MERFPRIFPSFLLLGAVLLGASCRRPPPDQERGRTAALQRICAAVQDNRTDLALEIARSDPAWRNTALAHHLESREANRRLLRRLNQALLAQRYSGALDIIQEAEQEGRASAELLGLKSLPHALQALQLFCARMPWEDPDDLLRSWRLLEKHEQVLEGSEQFREFRRRQMERLERLRRQAGREKADLWLLRIDDAWAGGRPGKAWELADRLRRSFPAHPLCLYTSSRRPPAPALVRLLAAPVRLSADEEVAFELALALAWPGLDSARRRAGIGIISREAAPPRTVSGAVLRAVSPDAGPRELAAALAAWRSVGGGDERLLPAELLAALRREDAALPGFPGIPAVLGILEKHRF